MGDSTDADCVTISDSESEAPDDMPRNIPMAHTTVILKNVPKCITTRRLKEILDVEGYSGRFDFCYAPMHFDSGNSFGYSFVNLTSENNVESFKIHFAGFVAWGADLVEDATPCEIEITSSAQGRSANIERYRNSPVLHKSVKDEFKPVLLSNGVEVPFPPPTSPIKAPRRRKNV